MGKRNDRIDPPNGKFISVDGVRLRYLDQGEGVPVVLLHGGVLWGNDFDQVIAFGASSGYRMLAFDRPGYGYSERPEGKVTPIDQADMLHQALASIGVHKPILVGHSWSGLLVLAYALRYPDEVSGIVTLGGGMYKEGYPAEKGDPISTLALAPVVGKWFMHAFLPTVGRWMAKQILKTTFSPEPVPSEYGNQVLSLWLRPSQFRANREDVVTFAPTAAAVSSQYHRIRIPTVIVVGAKDPFPTKAHSYRLHQELPGAVLIELANAAHMIPHHHPQAVIEAIGTVISPKGSHPLVKQVQ